MRITCDAPLVSAHPPDVADACPRLGVFVNDVDESHWVPKLNPRCHYIAGLPALRKDRVKRRWMKSNVIRISSERAAQIHSPDMC